MDEEYNAISKKYYYHNFITTAAPKTQLFSNDAHFRATIDNSDGADRRYEIMNASRIRQVSS